MGEVLRMYKDVVVKYDNDAKRLYLKPISVERYKRLKKLVKMINYRIDIVIGNPNV